MSVNRYILHASELFFWRRVRLTSEIQNQTKRKRMTKCYEMELFEKHK